MCKCGVSASDVFYFTAADVEGQLYLNYPEDCWQLSLHHILGELPVSEVQHASFSVLDAFSGVFFRFRRRQTLSPYLEIHSLW